MGNFGGYGTGKTLTSREEVFKHMLLTPKGNTLIGANVQSQYEQTIKRDIEADLPVAFVADSSSQKQYIDLLNGHRLMFRPFDDPEKLRSYNLSMFVIVEGSEVKGESFVQLKARLRNTAASVPQMTKSGKIKYKTTDRGVKIPLIDKDWRKGIIESNPDSGWIRSEVLMKSSDIQKHGEILDKYAVLESELDPAISSHIAATKVNEFLPPTFIADLTKNKPAWWINRYVYGSFLYAEGLVYPTAVQYIVKDSDIPQSWKRIVAYDYGLSDNSHFIFGAVDEREGILYIYKEICVNNRNIEELAKLFIEGVQDIPVGGWICTPLIDPKSGSKRDYDKKTLIDHFMDYGIIFKPGAINVDARIYRLNTYFEQGRVRIFESCKVLIKELREYKFPARSLDDNGKVNDKPEDKNNHGINALEWITMELPANPRNLLYGAYNKQGQAINTDDPIERPIENWQLSDNEDFSFDTRETAFGMLDYNNM